MISTNVRLLHDSYIKTKSNQALIVHFFLRSSWPKVSWKGRDFEDEMRKRRLPLPPLLAEFIETKGWRSRENSRMWKSFFPGGWRRRQIPFPSRSDSNREKTNACARAGPFPLDDGSLQALSLFHPTRRLPPLRGWFFADRADARSLPSIFFNSLEIITFHGLHAVCFRESSPNRRSCN